MGKKFDQNDQQQQSLSTNSDTSQQTQQTSTTTFVDNRSKAVAQRQLQETADNSPQVQKATQLQQLANPAPVVQRFVIQQATVAGLTADFNTDNVDACKQTVDTLFNEGQRETLANLYVQCKVSAPTDNDKAILKYISDKMALTTASVPENAPSGFADKLALQYRYWSQEAADGAVQAGLRMWVSGDPNRGVNWKMIGQHMRGTLNDDQYRTIGGMSFLLKDQRNGTNDAGNATQAEEIQEGRTLLNGARNDIRGALDALPDHDGLSYRQSGVANSSVYGGTVKVGDHIQDTSFWSTSALKISGSAGEWGQDGTEQEPKVYFIINGSNGKYISKQAKQEEGQHEVLFRDQATFNVTKICNFRNETFFVHLTEIDVATLGANPVIKNPYNGNTY